MVLFWNLGVIALCQQRKAIKNSDYLKRILEGQVILFLYFNEVHTTCTKHTLS